MTKATRKSAELEPYYGHPPDPKYAPKKHTPADLQFMTAVWYRGERYYVERVPASWEESHRVRVSSTPLREFKPGMQDPNTTDRETFCVHADLLELAPVTRTGNALTPVAAQRRERQKAGARDIGDEVATMLRGCKSLEEVYQAGAKYLKVDLQELRDRYAHLNPGQQRMNIGNRMRAKWKKDQNR